MRGDLTSRPVKLYRAMKSAADGLPEVGPTKRTLGVRPGDRVPNSDVPAVLPTDLVRPGDGGMSVAPGDPLFLPHFLRPQAFGGTGRDPVWELSADDLPAGLTARQDKPTHALVEPSVEMALAEFQARLAATRPLWRPTPSTGGPP